MDTARVKDVIRNTERLTGSITERPERRERCDLREVMDKYGRMFDYPGMAPEKGLFLRLVVNEKWQI